MKKIGLILMLLFVFCIGLTSCDSESNAESSITQNAETYDVTFLNYDNSMLYKAEDVKKGQPAIYVGSVPTRPSNSQFTYTFKGWDKDISSIQDDLFVFATYFEVPVDEESEEEDNTVELTGLSLIEKQRLYSGSNTVLNENETAYGVGRSVNALTDKYIEVTGGNNPIFNEEEITNIKWTKSPIRQQNAEVISATSTNEFYTSLKSMYQKKMGASAGVDGLFTYGVTSDFSISNSIEVNKDTKEIISKLYQNISSFSIEIEGYKDYRNFREYVSDELLADLDKLRNGTITAEQFISWYGTHVVMAGYYGGRIECNYHLMFNDASISSGIMASYKAQAGAALKDLQTSVAVAGGSSSGFDIKAQIGITGTELIESFSFNTRGGKYIDGKSDMASFMENYATWVSSFNENEDQYSVMMDVRDDSLIPVWLLFPEEYSDVKDMVEAKFNEMAKNAENEWLKKTAYTYVEEDEFPGYEIISSSEEFIQKISSNLNGNYVIVNDIDFGGTTITSFNQFNGKLIGKVVDGKNPTVKNFKLATKTYKHLGVFSELGSAGVIENINFSDASVDYNYDNYGLEGGFGVICGYNTGQIINCNVSNCTLYGYLYKNNGTNESVKLHGGAIAGWNNDNGIIKGCSATNIQLSGFCNGGRTDGTVECNIGGITGMNVGKGKVQNCSSRSIAIDVKLRGGKTLTWTNVRVRGRAGGIVGYNGGEAYIYDCTAQNSYSYNIYFEEAESTGQDKYFNSGSIVGLNDGTLSGNVSQ